MSDWLGEHARTIWGAIITAIAAAGAWFVRTVLTNEKRLSLLEQKLDMHYSASIESREELRRELAELKAKTDTAVSTQARIATILEKIQATK